MPEGVIRACAFRAPVYEHFRRRPYHVRIAAGDWDKGRMLDELKPQVYRSQVILEDVGEGGQPAVVDMVLFRLEPEVFAELNKSLLTVYAAEAAQAEDLARRLRSAFCRPPQPGEAGFHLLCVEPYNVGTQLVRLDVTTPMDPGSLALHYGDDMPEFERLFAQALETGVRGASIFRGEPGTGKTTFIRHLMARFHGSHRFYYLPFHAHRCLGSPEMVAFWTRDARRHPDAKRVVVLEDAEEALMDRGPDNKEQVATLLNVADGLLGEMLRVHLICTVNCPMDRLDPAIIRPGRLVAIREFRRLNPAAAGRLARARGLHLRPQADYSLAEIFAPVPLGSPAPPPPAIHGFAP